MGSFASTCCVSGLPIEDGDPIRYFLLTQNPYQKTCCYIYDRWVPRTWPIKALYNDYGTICNWEETPIFDSILKGFAFDLIEKGVGENSIHDVPVNKNMEFRNLLDAVFAGRLHIDGNARQRLVETGSPWQMQPADWQPTLQNVADELTTIPLTEGGRYLIDKQHDHIRVRWDGLEGAYGQDARYLGLAKTQLHKRFAVVSTAGYGAYARMGELRCFAAPGTTDNNDIRRVFVADDSLPVKPLLVQQAMIREDVWQALLTLKAKDSWDTYHVLDDYLKSVHAHIQEMEKDIKQTPISRILDDFGHRFRLKNKAFELPGCFLIHNEVVPFGNGLAWHAKKIIHDNALTSDLPLRDEGDMDVFTSLIAEFSFIWRLLQDVRYMWRPTDPSGGQCGDFDSPSVFYKALAKVADAITAAQPSRTDD